MLFSESQLDQTLKRQIYNYNGSVFSGKKPKAYFDVRGKFDNCRVKSRK